MATQSKTSSGNSTTYTITDVAGNTASVSQTKLPGYEVTCSYSGGPLLQDGNALMAQLMLLLSTGLTP